MTRASARDVLQRRLEVPLMCVALRVPRGGDVLELGCGAGNAFPALRRWLRPARLVGVDLQTSVGVRADVTALPFPDSTFDVVVDFGTCQDAGPQGLSEVVRVLGPGGVFVHETGWAQLLAHPAHGYRARGLVTVDGCLTRVATAGLWTMRRRA